MDDSKLIELVRDHPCVFNPRHPLYKDSNVRDNVWSEIAVKIKLPAEECRNRWKNIRDTFTRRKRAKKRPTGSASSKRVRRWHLEKYLGFMNVVDCERETDTNSITKVEETLVDGVDTELEAETVQRVEETAASGIRDPAGLDKDRSEEPELADGDGDGVPKKSVKRKKLAKLSGEDILTIFKRNSEDRSKIVSTILAEPNEQHPIDLFFKSMAMTVKTFSPENQIRARMQICQIVSELELEEVSMAQNVPQFDAMSFASTSNDSNSSFL